MARHASFLRTMALQAALTSAAFLFSGPAPAQVGTLSDSEQATGAPVGAPLPASNPNSIPPSSDLRDLRGNYQLLMMGRRPDGAPTDGAPPPNGDGAGGAPPNGARPPLGGNIAPPLGVGSYDASPPAGAPTNNIAAKTACLPSFAAFGGMDGGITIMQTNDEILIIAEEMHQVRHIYLTDEHSMGAKSSYLGDSIAHWNGDALIVETTELRAPPSASGITLTPGGILRELIRKNADGSLTDQMSYRAPDGTKTILMTAPLLWSPSSAPMEFICEDYKVDDADAHPREK